MRGVSFFYAYCVKTIMGSVFLGSEKPQKNLGQKNILGLKKKLGSKKNFGSKKFDARFW